MFGQVVSTPRPRETIQDVADEIRAALSRREHTQKFSKEFERRARQESYRLPDCTQLELDYRHSFWSSARDTTIATMQTCGCKNSRIDRVKCCGSSARVMVSTDGQDVRTVSNKCHDRLCQACGLERQRLITRNITEFCEGKELRFLTLTLKHNRETLSNQIDRLYTCFNRMRERENWKKYVDGGAVFFESPPAKDADEWHPHLHIIYEGKNFPHHLIKSDWLAVTGDSDIVHIEYVYNRSRALGYVAKYAAKPIDGQLYHRPKMLAEAITALQGRRSCTTFGTWRPNKKRGVKGLQLNEKPTEEKTWKDVGSLDEVKARADAGSLADRALMHRLRPNGGYAPTTTPHNNDPPTAIPPF